MSFTVPDRERPLFVSDHKGVGLLRYEGFEAVEITQGNDAKDIALRYSHDGNRRLLVPFLMNDAARNELVDACEQAGAFCYVPRRRQYVAGETSLVRGDDGLRELMADNEAEALEHLEEVREGTFRGLLGRLGVHDVFNVALEIASGEADRDRVPTGLDTLDKALGGGLLMGSLAILGATSSTGKTTLALQIADTIAASGRPTLFVTVEQGRHELVAKSISRLMRQIPKRNGGYYVASSADIQSGESRGKWGAPMHEAFTKACTDYSVRIAPNLYVMELERQPTTGEIRKAAEAIVRNSGGTPPLVFVDYLQLLAPASDRMSEKQAVDHNVMDLRHLARDLVTCVFAISSLNRASYSEGVTQEAFKETGAIEYSADVLLGMQPRGFDEGIEGAKATQQKRTARNLEREYKGRANREVEIRVLKNRGGAVPSEAVPLGYQAVCNLFSCIEAGEQPKKPRRVK